MMADTVVIEKSQQFFRRATIGIDVCFCCHINGSSKRWGCVSNLPEPVYSGNSKMLEQDPLQSGSD